MERINLCTIAGEHGGIRLTKAVANALGIIPEGRGLDISYSPEEAQLIIAKLEADTEAAQADARAKAAIVLQRQASREERSKQIQEDRARREARRASRSSRDPMTIWSGYVPLSLPPRIRDLVDALTTPERRVTQGDVLSLALDALERDLASRSAHPIE